MEQPEWRNLKLLLERPYKNDNGDSIPVLFDLTPEGQQVNEPGKSDNALGEQLRRIFIERGANFFDGKALDDVNGAPKEEHHEDGGAEASAREPTATMSTQELFKMRMEIRPQLFTALGEMTQAKELLSSLLSPLSSTENMEHTDSTLRSTQVTKPISIVSVQAFNAQLTIGGKDEGLRRAAGIFKLAAGSMERGRIRGEQYWADALKIRKGNWGLIPAPLPFGSFVGKGVDKTSRDFLVSYGLEESPATFRQRAIGHLTTGDFGLGRLIFPHRQNTRLRVLINTADISGAQSLSHNSIEAIDEKTLQGALQSAQREIVDTEIFSLLVREASHLPTVSARVSERLIVIDAAQGMELSFELSDGQLVPGDQTTTASSECDLVYHCLRVLLLRRHAHLKYHRLGVAGVARLAIPPDALIPPLLQPIIDLLQYRVFCERIQNELNKVTSALDIAGIQSSLSLNLVGETGPGLLNMFTGTVDKAIGGERRCNISQPHRSIDTSLAIIFDCPSISGNPDDIFHPQLCQLLKDEIERCLLYQICELGSKLYDSAGGTWFVDLDRCVGRWDGCVMNFRISFSNDFSIDCLIFRVERADGSEGKLDRYSLGTTDMSLLSWVEQQMQKEL
ncbi:subunit 17 of mediator complex-domain-containing protein [Infundibulicybe gibba]|nr:subunit 17 of mediator complex-domain-containing protein [Infundibulicybe gibba]